jgi:hypothetical protein
VTLLTTVFAQGTHAGRPAAAAGNSGYYYFETDTQTLFQSTGSAWAQLAASAAVAVFGASGPSHSSGLVPDPGSSAGSTHFLREDGSWAVPAGGGGGSPGGASTDVQVNDGGAFYGDSGLTYDKTTNTVVVSNAPNAGTTSVTLVDGSGEGGAFTNGTVTAILVTSGNTAAEFTDSTFSVTAVDHATGFALKARDASSAVTLCDGTEAVLATDGTADVKLVETSTSLAYGSQLHAGAFSQAGFTAFLGLPAAAAEFNDSGNNQAVILGATSALLVQDGAGTSATLVGTGGVAGVFQSNGGGMVATLANASSYAANFTDGTRTAQFADGTEAASFFDGTRSVTLGSAAGAGHFSDSTFTAVLIAGFALQGQDGTNSATLCDGTYAGHFQGPLFADGDFLTAQGNAGSYTTLGNIVGKWTVFDASHTLIGYVPIYDSIT